MSLKIHFGSRIGDEQNLEILNVTRINSKVPNP